MKPSNRKILILPLILVFALLASCSSSESSSTPEATTAEQSVAPTDSENDSASENDSLRTFVIIPEESKASYTVEEEFLAGALGPLGIEAGFNTAFGWTRNIEGQLSLDFSQVPPLVGESAFVVNIRTLSSDQDRRDEYIQRNFLQSNLFPLAEFVIMALENFPADAQEGEVIAFTLVGEMTIREITQPFSFEVEAILEGGVLSGTAISLLTMTDFGFDPPSIGGILTASDPALITLEFTMQELANPE